MNNDASATYALPATHTLVAEAGPILIVLRTADGIFEIRVAENGTARLVDESAHEATARKLANNAYAMVKRGATPVRSKYRAAAPKVKVAPKAKTGTPVSRTSIDSVKLALGITPGKVY